ncbi:hypothetical protein EVG20_g10243 [Dentipellis fragilis]|uniref:Uncharacterized protein n=1 Tax=Dentipellis fragilis TaxID=205917 RepID=A0A4Y9XUQ2_9AGAM|nr:hypothetical protein EVG20_g10243 [Dentipellis fragilis]
MGDAGRRDRDMARSNGSETARSTTPTLATQAPTIGAQTPTHGMPPHRLVVALRCPSLPFVALCCPPLPLSLTVDSVVPPVLSAGAWCSPHVLIAPSVSLSSPAPPIASSPHTPSPPPAPSMHSSYLLRTLRVLETERSEVVLRLHLRAKGLAYEALATAEGE